jgi:hypothetical protein
MAKPQIAQELSLILAQRQASLAEATAMRSPGETENSAKAILTKIWNFLKT